MFEGTGKATTIVLLEREIIKVTADSILAVDTLLGDVEVLDVDETPLRTAVMRVRASSFLPSGVEQRGRSMVIKST